MSLVQSGGASKAEGVRNLRDVRLINTHQATVLGSDGSPADNR
jgi:hypothetical protein